MKRQLAVGTLALLAIAAVQDFQDPMSRLRTRLEDNAADFWIYDDLETGYATAAETGKPLLVSFRCVP
jgi:hypothetical protein